MTKFSINISTEKFPIDMICIQSLGKEEFCMKAFMGSVANLIWKRHTLIYLHACLLMLVPSSSACFLSTFLLVHEMSKKKERKEQ